MIGTGRSASSTGPEWWVAGYAFDGDVLYTGRALADFLGRVRSPSDLAGVGGSFAAIVPRPEGLRIFTDRYGSYPVFYRRTTRGWIAGEDYWALTEGFAPETPSGPNAVMMLALSFTPGDGTLSDSIREAPPSAWLDLHHGGGSFSQRYWRLTPSPRPRSGRQLVAELCHTADRVAARTVRAGEAMGMTRWGLNLTAGADSRWMLAALLRTGVPLATVSSRVGEDAQVAETLAKSVGVKHRSLTFWEDQGKGWVPGIADAVVPTTIASVAGHPMTIRITGALDCDGYVSGHLGDSFTGGPLSRLLRGPRLDADSLHERIRASNRRIQVSELRKLLRPEWRDLAEYPDSYMGELIADADDAGPVALVQRDRLEQHQRRYTLRDQGALRTLGPSPLWFGDAEWVDFWASVPTQWLVGSSLYSAGFKAYVAQHPRTAPLGQHPVNGSHLRSVRFPRIARIQDEAVRRVRKRIMGAPRSPSPGPRIYTLEEWELERVSWLVEPDYFVSPRPRSLVETVRSIARATELLSNPGRLSS